MEVSQVPAGMEKQHGPASRADAAQPHTPAGVTVQDVTRKGEGACEKGL